MKKHKHIPLEGGRITWIGKVDPTEEELDVFQKMIDAVNQRRDLEIDHEPSINAENDENLK